MRNIDKRIRLRIFILAMGRLMARNQPATTFGWRLVGPVLAVCWMAFAIPPLQGRDHKHEEFGLGFSTEIEASESELLQAVGTVVDDGIIQGSYEYNKDKYIDKASAATSSSLFPPWKDPGTVFYKDRTKVLAPANFKDTSDEGTVAVRYVVQSKDANRSILRIDAIFVEDFRRTAHVSNGSVESAEFKDIQDHIDALELQKTQARQSEKQRQEELARQALERKSADDEALALSTAQNSAQAMEQHVQELRRKAERVIKAPGAELKSAPFHTASTLKSLEAGTEVVIIVVTLTGTASNRKGDSTDGFNATNWSHCREAIPLDCDAMCISLLFRNCAAIAE
jgi:hypothetical protein